LPAVEVFYFQEDDDKVPLIPLAGPASGEGTAEMPGSP
jgi:hypothetical protein